MRSCVWFLVLSALVVPKDVNAQAPSLDSLLASFRGLSGLSARFREEKQVALLAAPLRSEGEIHFAPPGRLLRRVTGPTTSAALIADGRLTMSAGGRRQQFDLSRQPLVAGFVDSFRYVLAGDRAALERAYDINFTVQDGTWELRLRPKASPLREFLREMVMVGRGVVVSRLRMTEASGDVTTTDFFDVDVGREWSPSEVRRVFRVE
ncbi:MAG: outer membrane lipoprotein carrier protein LolA [Myxococcota bacterium]